MPKFEKAKKEAVIAAAAHLACAVRAILMRRQSPALAQKLAYATLAAGFVVFLAVVLASARIHVEQDASANSKVFVGP